MLGIGLGILDSWSLWCFDQNPSGFPQNPPKLGDWDGHDAMDEMDENFFPDHPSPGIPGGGGAGSSCTSLKWLRAAMSDGDIWSCLKGMGPQ